MNNKRVNIIRLKQDGWQLADDILKCIFLKDTSCICIIFLPVGPTENNGSLIHWGRVTHKCVGKLTIIGSDNGLSPHRCQAIIWTNAGLLLIRTIFSDFLSEIRAFSFKKMLWQCRPENGSHLVSASMCWLEVHEKDPSHYIKQWLI